MSEDGKYITIQITPKISSANYGPYYAVFTKEVNNKIYEKSLTLVNLEKATVGVIEVKSIQVTPGQKAEPVQVAYRCTKCDLLRVTVKSSDNHVYNLESDKYRLLEQPDKQKLIQVDLDMVRPQDIGSFMMVFRTEDNEEEYVKFLIITSYDNSIRDIPLEKEREEISLNEEREKRFIEEEIGERSLDKEREGISIEDNILEKEREEISDKESGKRFLEEEIGERSLDKGKEDISIEDVLEKEREEISLNKKREESLLNEEREEGSLDREREKRSLDREREKISETKKTKERSLGKKREERSLGKEREKRSLNNRSKKTSLEKGNEFEMSEHLQPSIMNVIPETDMDLIRKSLENDDPVDVDILSCPDEQAETENKNKKRTHINQSYVDFLSEDEDFVWDSSSWKDTGASSSSEDGKSKKKKIKKRLQEEKVGEDGVRKKKINKRKQKKQLVKEVKNMSRKMDRFQVKKNYIQIRVQREKLWT
ncbi:hypothetical protein ACJJTC_005099 [Scirpophaga incertulas]